VTIYAADGTTKLSKTGLLAKTTDVPVTEVVVNEDIYEAYNYDPYRDNFKTFEGERRKKFAAGQVVKKSAIDDLYPTATFASIAPATGAAAGSTPVTIKGTHLAGATGASLGGVALTSFTVVNDTTITGVSGAHATGAVNVVINDDAGNVTATNAFTYV
jgi:IPT/TIG domain-containing protein